MNTKILKLCIVALYGAFAAASSNAASDTIPLSSKTKASPVNPDTLEGEAQPAPMFPIPKKPKKDETGKDVVSGLKDAPKDEPEQEPVPDANPQQNAYIGSIDVYGTDRITEVDLKNFFGKELDSWVDLGMKNDPAAYDLQRSFADRAKKKWDLADAEWSLAQYFTQSGMAVHLTLDVVEKKDVSKRMAFLEEPKETHADPDGLLAQWRKYEEIALDMVGKGELSPDTERCVAFHCPFAHKNAKLRPFEKIFIDGAKKHHKELFAILKGDKDPENRAAAAFVLPYYTNGKEIVAAMVERIPDPDPIVRNNVLRVLGAIAERHRDIPVPLAPVMKAFEYPRVSDRSKALNVAYQLAEHSPVARESLRKSGPQLLTMLASKQPDHRELAHGILRKISGRDFAPDDDKSWQRWVRTVTKDSSTGEKRKDAAISKK